MAGPGGSHEDLIGSGRGLALLILLAAAALFPDRVLDRSRPSAGVLPLDPVRQAEQGETVPARLWEDPLEAAYSDAARLRKDGKSLQSPGAVHASIEEVLAECDAGSLLLLPVVIPGGSQPESRENRLQFRYAVVSALGVQGYTPRDGQRLGYFESRLRRDAPVVPFELFRRQAAGGFTHVLVLWLDEDLLRERPARDLVGIAADLLGAHEEPRRDSLCPTVASGCGIQQRRAIRVLLSTGSTSLIGLLDDWPRGGAPDTAWVGEGTIFAPTATVDRTVLDERTGRGNDPLAERNGWELGEGWRLFRTIGQDQDLARALLEEVRCRVAGADGPRIAVFAEWDTDYGRAWKRTLGRAWKGVFEGTEAGDRLVEYHYLAGIDGRVPGETQEAVLQEELDRGLAKGTERTDYLLRLMDRLQLDPACRYDAIGVLGSDVHDKLLLLSVLRTEFPGTVFFTTDLDARYLDPAAYDHVHNLVIASHYGIDLEKEWQCDIPPFRSSYQAAVFHCAQLMLAAAVPDTGTAGKSLVHLYEIGRSGPFELTPELCNARAADRSPDPTRRVNREPLLRLETRQRLGSLGGLLLGGVLVALILRGFFPAARGESVVWGQAQRTGSAFVLLLALLAAAFLAQANQPYSEPFALLEGVSIWPSEILRILAASLALGWQYRVRVDLRQEIEVTGKNLGIGPRPPWKDPGSTEVRLGTVPDQGSDTGARPPRRKTLWSWLGMPWLFSPPDTMPPRVVDLYDELQGWSTDTYRRRRTACFMALFLLAASCVFACFGRPSVPARGWIARLADQCVIVISVLSMQWLIYLVVDSAMLVSRFLQRMADDDLVNPDRPPYRRTPLEKLVKDECAWAKRRMEAAASLTERIGRFLYYPSIVVLLMVLSRLPVFDDWSFPWPLVIVVSLSLIVLGVCYVMVWNSARRLRRRVLESLHREKGTVREDPVQGKALEELLAEVRGIRRGAFAPFWEHPLLRAALIPFAGFGSLSLVQFLSR